MTKQTIPINGMSCGHCVRSVQQALEAIDGVTVDQVTIGSASVTYDPARVSETQIASAIAAQGYEVARA